MPGKRHTSKPTTKEPALTVMVVPRSGSVLSFSVPRWVGRGLLLACALCLVTLLGFGVRFRAALSGVRELNALRTLTEQQKRQLDQMTQELDTMRDELGRVREMEQRVRDLLQSERAVIEQTLSRQRPLDAPGGVLSAARAGDELTSRSGDRGMRSPSDHPGAEKVPGTQGDPALLQREVSLELSSTLSSLASLEGDLRQKIAELRALPTLFPVNGHVTSPFGVRQSPVGRRGEFHDGVDIAAPYGSVVRAAGDGVVTSTGWDAGYGRVVVIAHGNGIASSYCHLSAIDAKVGQSVKRGDPIGRVGTSGIATGPHLHFMTRVNGVPVDPMNYLK